MSPSEDDRFDAPGLSLRATFLSRGRLLIPNRGRLPGGLWMHSACKPMVVKANNLVGHLAKLSVKLVPGSATHFRPPMAADEWREALSELVGTRSDQELIVMRPLDARRSRILVMVLSESGYPIAFLKATHDPPSDVSTHALERLQSGARGFLFPRVRSRNRVGDWWVTIEEALPQLAHRPARMNAQQRHELVVQVQEIFGAGPGDTVLAHGDFGPWNVRRFSDSSLGILDWEYAAWAPAATDEVWHSVMFPMAATRKDGKAIGRHAKRSLSSFYSAQQLEEAASYLANRWEEEEPREMNVDVERSPQLVKFEARFLDALRELGLSA